MKTLNTAIVTALLAMGLAGNAMANNHGSDKDHKVVKKVVVQKVVKQVVVKKAAPKKMVKQVVVKKAPPKKVIAKTYHVRAGDTLSKISARTHVPVNSLIKLNKLWGNKANQLRVGTVLRLS
ncbi:LysM peptidoglycan-binding domain-containing protein [Leucothrix mucor]|uniref:LysM peptidoglycan-binding domain-containing protein n=1 Tax=Leucothrix mucor TaxID=45248 RepID=UPI0003B42AC7|nr:LysM domain-containing protein [Leucothrix mucor]